MEQFRQMKKSNYGQTYNEMDIQILFMTPERTYIITILPKSAKYCMMGAAPQS